MLDNYLTHWISGLIPLMVFASMVALPVFVRRRWRTGSVSELGDVPRSHVGGGGRSPIPDRAASER